jgi:hypothetical protein
MLFKDDRKIASNPTENKEYNLVERPKNLIKFNQYDIEKHFLFTLFKSEKVNILTFLIIYILLNKLMLIFYTLEANQTNN